MRIDEIEEFKKRQGMSIGISSPASYFAAALEREQEAEEVGSINTVKESRNTTDHKNLENTKMISSEKDEQTQMANKDEGVQKSNAAQGYFDMLAAYNRYSLDLS